MRRSDVACLVVFGATNVVAPPPSRSAVATILSLDKHLGTRRGDIPSGVFVSGWRANTQLSVASAE
jgi:hypothetical protein